MTEKDIYEKWRMEYEEAFPQRGPVTFGQKHMWKHGYNAYRNALRDNDAESKGKSLQPFSTFEEVDSK